MLMVAGNVRFSRNQTFAPKGLMTGLQQLRTLTLKLCGANEVQLSLRPNERPVRLFHNHRPEEDCRQYFWGLCSQGIQAILL